MAFLDSHALLVVAGVSVAGALIGLDRTAVGQFMISQPIVAGPLAGWMLGDAATGLLIGTTLELIWLLDMPVGSFVPADSTVASIVATASAILGGHGAAETATVGFCLLFTVVLAPVTMLADTVARKFNARLAQDALTSSGDALRRTLVRAQLYGAGVFFLKSLAVYLVFIPLGSVAARLFLVMPDAYHRAMELFMKLLPLVGAAFAIRKLSIRAVDASLATGFVIAALLGLIFKASAFVIMPLALAGGWLGNKYREHWS